MKCISLTASIDPALEAEEGLSPVPGATWYHCAEYGVGIEYAIKPGALAGFAWLTCDVLLDGVEHAIFRLLLTESHSGRVFAYRFGLLNQVGARLRLPLSAVDQGRWQTGREGALLKPMCTGAAVDLAAVDGLRLNVDGGGDSGVRFCMTPLTATTAEPPLMTNPVLPAGPVADELGQSRLRRWSGRSASHDEVTARLRSQLDESNDARLPDGWSAWGGWRERRFDATGFFHTARDARRWWLVDPDGCAFWSMGVDCVRSSVPSYLTGIESAYTWLPDQADEFKAALSASELQGRTLQFCDFLRVNLIRAFGEGWHDSWSKIALAHLRRFGFNTVANWSDWEVARAARVPYVRPLIQLRGFEQTPMVFRDFPDVFDPSFPGACTAYARQLETTRGDPSMIGYFLMNEPTWGFARMPLAEGMLRNTPAGPCRKALAEWVGNRYGDGGSLASAWDMDVSFQQLAEGLWERPVTEAASKDLTAFSSVMVERLFRSLTEACRAVDPDHLNLGARYYIVPPDWVCAGMRHFDVFSINGYQDSFPAERVTELNNRVEVPVMIGEWHFGALDVGLPGGSLRRVRDQQARGDAYRVYAEGALAHPGCVGIHWFTLYDESPMGRFDGENWNTGFLDVCHRPYPELAEAARRTHERLYPLVAGRLPPYAGRIECLRKNVL